MHRLLLIALACAAGCPSTPADGGAAESGSTTHDETLTTVTAGGAPATATPPAPSEDVAEGSPAVAADAEPDAGVPASVPAPPVAPSGGGPSSCAGSGEYSGPSWGLRCENTESYAQGPGYERVEGATSVEQCLAACSGRPDCTAVSDFLAMRPADGCYLEHGDCDARSKPDFAEEDGARTHRKVCDDQGACSFESIPGNFHCGDAWDDASQVEAAESIEDCLDACTADPTCTAVRDYFYTQRVPGCYLNTTACDAPVMNFQDGDLYVKCD